VYGLAFSPDGKLLAAGDMDGIVRVWPNTTGEPVGNPIDPDGINVEVSDVAFSSDGKLLVTAEADGNVRLWNPSTGAPVGVRFPPGVYSNSRSQLRISGSPGHCQLRPATVGL
jgi:WD40 repeat protein